MVEQNRDRDTIFKEAKEFWVQFLSQEKNWNMIKRANLKKGMKVEIIENPHNEANN